MESIKSSNMVLVQTLSGIIYLRSWAKGGLVSLQSAEAQLVALRRSHGKLDWIKQDHAAFHDGVLICFANPHFFYFIKCSFSLINRSWLAMNRNVAILQLECCLKTDRTHENSHNITKAPPR